MNQKVEQWEIQEAVRVMLRLLDRYYLDKIINEIYDIKAADEVSDE